MNRDETAALNEHDKGRVFFTAAKRIGVSVPDLVNASLGREASDRAQRAFKEERGAFPTIPADAWPYRCGGCNAALDKTKKKACTRCAGVICHACGTVHPACKVVASHERDERQKEAAEQAAALAATFFTDEPDAVQP